MNARRFRVLASLAITGAIAACVVDPLNPQPLPPGPENQDTFADGGVFGTISHDASRGADSGALSDTDAATPTNNPSADGGDAGDAAADADADAY